MAVFEIFDALQKGRAAVQSKHAFKKIILRFPFLLLMFF